MWLLPNPMNLQLLAFYLDVENAACRLPVDWFVTDWTVNKKRAVRFDD